MLKAPTIEEIVAYVVKWVEDRYKDDEYVSVALEATIHAVRTIKREDNILGYVMRSVYRACRAHRIDRLKPLTLDVEQIASADLDLKETGLTTIEQEVVRQHIQHDMSYNEIADMVDMSYVQVRYIYYRAINKLRDNYVADPHDYISTGS